VLSHREIGTTDISCRKGRQRKRSKQDMDVGKHPFYIINCYTAMIIYNVTTNVNWAIHNDWLQWIQQEHIPQILQTGCFFDSRILRLLEIDDEDGPTYAIQFHASTTYDYQTFIKQHDALLKQQSYEKWGDQIIAFSSVMEVLH
jgi:hypothetical protein